MSWAVQNLVRHYLDDEFHLLFSELRRFTDSGPPIHVLKWKRNRWQLKERYIKSSGDSGSETHADIRYNYGFKRIANGVNNTSDQIIYRYSLFEPTEIPKPSAKSPSELKQIAKTTIPEELLINRFKSRRFVQSRVVQGRELSEIRGWEREI